MERARARSRVGKWRCGRGRVRTTTAWIELEDFDPAGRAAAAAAAAAASAASAASAAARPDQLVVAVAEAAKAGEEALEKTQVGGVRGHVEAPGDLMALRPAIVGPVVLILGGYARHDAALAKHHRRGALRHAGDPFLVDQRAPWEPVLGLESRVGARVFFARQQLDAPPGAAIGRLDDARVAGLARRGVVPWQKVEQAQARCALVEALLAAQLGH